MSDVAVVCVVSRNYLAGARVLAESVRRSIPEATPFIFLLDRPPAPWDARAEPGECVFAESLGIPDWKRFAFQYTPFELACALKPHAVRYVLGRGFRRVLYVDSDQAFYSSPAGILSALDEGAALIITPHATAPIPAQSGWNDESAYLHAGAYNAGFLALRACDATDRFLDWWSARLRRDCIVDIAGGLHVDQRWLDLVPGMFDDVRIERTPGVNTAFWTLWWHVLSRTSEGTYLAGDAPLVCFHFTGFDPADPSRLSSYDPSKADIAGNSALRELLSGYAADLKRCGWSTCQDWGCELDRLRDGTAISPYWREAIRDEEPTVRDIADPFDTDATPDLAARLRALESKMRSRRVDWRLQVEKPTGWQRFLRPIVGYLISERTRRDQR